MPRPAGCRIHRKTWESFLSENFDQHGLCFVEFDFYDLLLLKTLHHVTELLESDLAFVKIRIFLLKLGLDDAGIDPVESAAFQLIQQGLQDIDPVGLADLP